MAQFYAKIKLFTRILGFCVHVGILKDTIITFNNNTQYTCMLAMPSLYKCGSIFLDHNFVDIFLLSRYLNMEHSKPKCALN